MTARPYVLQILQNGRWVRFDCAPQTTEQAAWEQLSAWERYCPTDRFRWVRAIR